MDDATGIPTRPAGGSTAVIDTEDPSPIPSVPATPDTPAATTPTPDRRPSNPLENVTFEHPRSHPIAWAALALAAIALLLSLFSLGGDDDDGFRQVKIGEQDCVIGQQGDVDVLYCRTAGLPAQ